MRVQVAFWKY